MAAPATSRITPAEYLDRDRASEIRHEYIDGRMVAMSGGTGFHSILSSEVNRHLGNALEGLNSHIPSDPVHSRDVERRWADWIKRHFE